MPSGLIGVYSTREKPKQKEKKVLTRQVPCSNGHVVGQVFIQAIDGWRGDCPVCGECPKS
jgi:hypothetical protein